MRETRFLCLAVSRREGGNCIAGIDIDTGKWIRPVNAASRGAFADHELFVKDAVTGRRRFMMPLDLLELRLDQYAGGSVQRENWTIVPGSYERPYTVTSRFTAPEHAQLLRKRLDLQSPLLHTYSKSIPADDPLIRGGLTHSLSLIQPEQLHWNVAPDENYHGKRCVWADFHFCGDPYRLKVTDPPWEERCKRLGDGRYPHGNLSKDSSGEVFLTISLTELPFKGYHYKLVAAVICQPN